MVSVCLLLMIGSEGTLLIKSILCKNSIPQAYLIERFPTFILG